MSDKQVNGYVIEPRADLEGADLEGANLEEADLRRADLRRADLRRADLWGAYLQGANLEGARLKGADLGRVNLQGASFLPTLPKALKWVAQVHRSDGYEFLGIALEDGSLLIRAGCRTLLYEQYLEHVAKKYPDTGKAEETLSILAFIHGRHTHALGSEE